MLTITAELLRGAARAGGEAGGEASGESGPALLAKALSCMKELRWSAIKEGEPDAFNQLLRTVRADFCSADGRLGLPGSRRVWEALGRDAVLSMGLISAAECEESHVQEAEARAFIGEAAAAAAAAQTVEPVAVPAAQEEEDELAGLD